jgi:hypothetical protein
MLLQHLLPEALGLLQRHRSTIKYHDQIRGAWNTIQGSMARTRTPLLDQNASNSLLRKDNLHQGSTNTEEWLLYFCSSR